MTEIGVACAGGEDQRVIGQSVAVLEQHALALRVDAADGREQGGDFRPVAQRIADRPGDLRGRERGGRDLIQQRLEQMMVAPVDQRDADRCAFQSERRFRPPKPAPTITTRWDAVVVMAYGLWFRVSRCMEYVCIGGFAPRAICQSADSENLSRTGVPRPRRRSGKRRRMRPKILSFRSNPFAGANVMEQDAMILHRANQRWSMDDEPELADKNAALIAGVFAELRIAEPEGVRHLSLLLDRGNLVHFVETGFSGRSRRPSARMRPKLHCYCARMTGLVIDGEDVLQDALIKAMQSPTRSPPSAISAARLTLSTAPTIASEQRQTRRAAARLPAKTATIPIVRSAL